VVLGVGYLRKLLENPRVLRYLSQHHAEIQAEFQKLVEFRGHRDGVQGKPPAE
jgi:hypothetical protein